MMDGDVNTAQAQRWQHNRSCESTPTVSLPWKDFWGWTYSKVTYRHPEACKIEFVSKN